MDQLNIRRLTETEYLKMTDLAPVHALRTATIVLAGFIESSPTGIIILMKKDDNWALTWIYVLPKYQKQGIGSKLLDRAILEAKKNGTHNLEVVLEGETEEGKRFMSMLSHRDFFIDFHMEPIFSVTNDQLSQALFYTKPEILGSNIFSGDTIIPLRNAKSKQLERFIRSREQRHNYAASRADYTAADPHLSRLLISNSQIVGAILVDPVEEGVYSLDLCFIEKDYLKVLIRLMKSVSDNLLANKDSLKRIEFSCSLKSTLQVAKILLPEHSITSTGIITGWKNLQSNI